MPLGRESAGSTGHHSLEEVAACDDMGSFCHSFVVWSSIYNYNNNYSKT